VNPIRNGLLIVMLAIILGSIPLFAEESTPTTNDALTVKKITFQGAEDGPEDMFRAIIQTKVGEEIFPDQLTKDIKNLYKDTGFFADIAVDVEPYDEGGLEVIYRLTENPKIKGGITIIGNEKLSYKKIKGEITLKAGEIYSDQRRWESEQRILNAYRNVGYYLVAVQTHADINPDDNTISVTFEISEGPRIKVQEINFIGNHDISLKKLSKQMKIRVGKHFDEKLIKADLVTLLHYYQDRGYTQAKIDDKYEKRFTDDKTGLMLDITVDEGTQYIVDTYDIKLQQSEKPAFSEKKIRDMLDPPEGEIFNSGAFQKSLDEIQQGYQNKGYILAEIMPDANYDEENGSLEITLNINEGDVIVIDKVSINGLEKTRENVIRRELDHLDIKSGEFFDVASLRKARQRLFQMGPFIRGVDFIPSESEGTHRDLSVNVAETARTGMFSLGGGYGTEGGIFGVAEIGENNLFGRAYRVHLKGELGARDRHTAELRFNTPWILGTPTRLNLSLYNTRRSYRYNRYYSHYPNTGNLGNLSSQTSTNWGNRDIFTRKGGSITLGRPITRDMDISVRLKNERVHYNRAYRPDSLEIEDIVSRLTRSVTFFLSRDTRDYWRSSYYPVSGLVNTASYEYAGGIFGAENRFQRYSLDSSWFLNTGRHFVFATHVRAGYLSSRLDDSRYLRYERYRLGGDDTIRGYDWHEIRPSNGDYGGNKMVYANFEYRIPISPQLTGAVFFDIGHVWHENTSNIFKDLSFKKGAGVGIRFDLLGMLARIEWGYGFDRDRDGDGNKEPGGKIHFTIGPGF
jgi:outer membrane protein insertion porin family